MLKIIIMKVAFSNISYNKFKEIVIVLLEIPSFDPNTITCDEYSLMGTVYKNDDFSFAQFLLENFKLDCNEAFYHACTHSKIKWINLFLEIPHLDPNEHFNGYTALFYACDNNLIDVVKILLEDPRVTGFECEEDIGQSTTPFYVACRNGYIDIVKLFLMNDRINHHEGYYGWDGRYRTPLYIACRNSNINIINLLLTECTDLEIPDEEFSDEVESILDNYRSELVLDSD